MIGVVTSPFWHGGMLRRFLDEFAPELTPEIQLLDWGRLLRDPAWPEHHTWIFVAIDPGQRTQLVEVEKRLRAEGKRVLNAPSTFLQRLELQKQLRAAGVNTFEVHSTEHGVSERWRYPIFIRHRHEHNGSMTALLNNIDEARAEVGRRPYLCGGDMMAVEYVDTLGPGALHRKYSFMRIGDRYVARHVMFSKQWMIKYEDVIDEKLALEELTFVEHATPPAAVVKAFDIGGIQYGRIDYGFEETTGHLQVWEINQSPVVIQMKAVPWLRERSQRGSAMRIAHALKELCNEPRA